MRDPSSARFAQWQQLMATGDMVGHTRPVGRVSIGRNQIRGHLSNRPGVWRNILFEQPRQVEIPYVKSISIDRALGQDAATCQITLYNDSMHSAQYSPQGVDTGIGRPGFRTYNRGLTTPVSEGSVYNDFVGKGTASDYPTDWGYPEVGTELGGEYEGTFVYDGGSGAEGGADYLYNRELLIPNRLVRTYQGYGSDNFDANGNEIERGQDGYIAPHRDTQLVQTGIWLIDRVTYTSSGLITLECRDLAKILMEQIIHPPMIPMERYPLTYSPQPTVTLESETGSGANVATLGSSSGDIYNGPDASLFGHRPSHAFDGLEDTFWLSVGHPTPTGAGSFEWLQADTKGNEVNAVTLVPVNAAYIAYVSVMQDGAWQGTETVPYTPDAGWPDNGSAIPYVQKQTLGTYAAKTLILPLTYRAQQVRVTFTNLYNTGMGDEPYRAGLKEFQVFYSVLTEANPGEPPALPPGEISDWSEAIKELLGWAGFTWWARSEYYGQISPDYLLGRDAGNQTPLRVWGDFEYLGAGPVEPTNSDYFMNKSFMEAITQVKDFIGAVFYIAEDGGGVFHMPNILSGGNFVIESRADASTPAYLKREWPIEFHENANLLDYSITIDDSQVRSEILVIGENPDMTEAGFVAGGYVLGTNPISEEVSAINFTQVLAGQTRLFIVPNDHTKLFRTKVECQRMAEMTALYILFTYRKGRARIVAHPGLQLDDQVRIFERVTNESNIHYVSGISSNMDLETGEWTMDVTTHWLGGDPDTDWFVNFIDLTPAVMGFPAIQERLAGDATQQGGVYTEPVAQEEP